MNLNKCKNKMIETADNHTIIKLLKINDKKNILSHILKTHEVGSV